MSAGTHVVVMVEAIIGNVKLKGQSLKLRFSKNVNLW
jgi:hypothetical protein